MRPSSRSPLPAVRVLLAVVAAAVGVATCSSSASAAAPENGWTCRAQTLTATAFGVTPLQELTNALAAGGEFQPCSTVANSPVGSALKPLADALAAAGIGLGVTQAETAADVARPARDQLPTAHAKVADVTVRLAGVELVHVDAAESRVSATCVGTTPTLESSYDVGEVRIFGQAIDLNQPVIQVSRGLAGLETVVRVTPGAETDDPRFGRTRRALRIEVIQNVGVAPVGLLDLGVGVSNVTVKGAPCAAAATPDVGVPTADGRTLTSKVDPPAGTTIARCSFAVTAAGGGAASTVPGIYAPATGNCTAVLTPDPFTAGSYTATATATTSAGGAATSAASPPFTLAAPTAAAPTVLVPSLDGRTVAATVTPAAGTTIASCRFVITPRGGAPVAVAGTFADRRCAATLARASFPPGEYAIAASATASNGEVGQRSGSGTIAGPSVGTPIAVGPLVGAPVKPGAGATVRSCSIAVTPAAGGPTTTLPGNYDAPTGGCAAILPAATYPSGDYSVAVTVVDSGGDAATARGTVTVGQLGALPTTPPAGGATTPAGSATTSDVGQALIACDKRKLALIDVTRSGSRVRLAGVAQTALAGRSVVVRFAARGRSATIVARLRVAADGTYAGSVRAPAARFRTTRANGRYTASIAGSTTAPTKLVRRLTVSGVSRSGSRLTIKGRIAAPLPRTRQLVVITRRTSCTRYQTVARVRASATGRFTASFAPPADGSAGLYRASTKVPSKAGGPARNSTFTLPRIIAGR